MTLNSRRSFLQTTARCSAMISLARFSPAGLQAAAEKNASGRILVVIELAGGNDGLNTVVPFAEEAYYQLRPKLGIPRNAVLRIDDKSGFHPALKGFADLLEAGELAIVQGVGYPNPNRSHFESMDIWHTCQRKQDVRNDGWIGRLLENHDRPHDADPSAMHIGHDKQPFALMSRTIRVPSIRSLDEFRLQGADDADFRKAVQELSEDSRKDADDLLNFVQSSTSSALSASERLRDAARSMSSTVSYPQNSLGEHLRTVAGLIGSGLSTSVYYVQLNGFDTHSQQPEVHQSLLRQLGDSVRAFLEDIRQMKRSDQVAVMAFSEFGRRVAENASEGTDHGTAGPVFLAGAMVRPGLIGRHPDMHQLQDGDLQHHTDFRQVYAAIARDWFKCQPSAILKGDFRPIDVFRV